MVGCWGPGTDTKNKQLCSDNPKSCFTTDFGIKLDFYAGVVLSMIMTLVAVMV
jgi:hypothetical protein